MYPPLSICAFLPSVSLAQTVQAILSRDRYRFTVAHSESDFYASLDVEKPTLDCLILQTGTCLPTIAKRLHGQAILLPALIFCEPPQNHPEGTLLAAAPSANAPAESAFLYHTAEVQIAIDHVNELDSYIDRAIAQFIHLSPLCRINPTVNDLNDFSQTEFVQQQQQLTEKLKERLGYLGVYYKRNPQKFFRHLPNSERQALLETLKADYREIVLRYFENEQTLNDRIDALVNSAFFSDIAVSQLVEIHMELMDEFSKQLKLEGRSEEILLDYRLTLIDTIAHLCEMYRRSIPRETE